MLILPLQAYEPIVDSVKKVEVKFVAVLK